MALAAGDRLGPYEILAPLGAGGLGEVYKARDTRDNREVSIKVIVKSEGEARTLAALNHPHICTLYEAGPDRLVMELVDGVPLRGPLSQQETLRFASEICDALDYGQQHGVKHGDLRPSNVLVTPQGIKLLNFGLVDDSSDIYAFGGVLYEMLMGRALAEDRRPVQPAALEKVLQRCVASDPAQRFQSVAALKQALTAVSHPTGFRREYIVAAGSIVMLIAGLALLVMQFPSNQRLSDKDVLVLADFGNATGDKIFDGTLRTALALQLEQSPFLKTLDDDEMQQDLKLMGRPPDTRISNVIAHDVCVREGQKAMIDGAIADLGKVFVITVQAVNCQNGATLAREQVQAEGREQVLNAISKGATGIRAKLGESPTSLQKFVQVTSAPIEAFQAYAQGVSARNQGRELASIPSFEHAVQLDPNFAIAHLQLYLAYSNSGQTSAGEDSLTKAFALASHASEFDRLRIQALYYRVVTGEVNRAIDANLLLSRTYPRNRLSHNQLGSIYSNLGEWEKALAQYQTSADPSLNAALILADARLDRFDEAKSVSRIADVAAIHRALLRVAFMQSDAAAAAKEIEWFSGKPEEYQSLAEQSQNALIHGEFKKAAALAQQGAQMAEQHGLEAASGQLLSQVAGMNEFLQSCEALQQIGAVAALLCSEVQPPPADRPNDTLLNAVRLPVARATLDLQQNKPSEAIEALQSASPYEQAYSQVPYLRGIAYLRRNQGAAAAAAFQKILDHKGANWGVVYPLSYLGVGRGWALAGESAKAKTAYQAFFAMWKDADTNLPVFAQAQKEFAALK